MAQVLGIYILGGVRMVQVLGIYILRRGTQLVVKISAIGFSKENCFARRFELMLVCKVSHFW